VVEIFRGLDITSLSVMEAFVLSVGLKSQDCCRGSPFSMERISSPMNILLMVKISLDYTRVHPDGIDLMVEIPSD